MTTEPMQAPDTRLTLLIADDDAVTVAALSALLHRDFRLVGTAADALAAAALAEQHRPDAAIIDVQMPEGGAREAVHMIVRRSPGTSIVILSGDESGDSVRELLTTGASAYLRKGVSGEEISTTLTNAVEARRAVAGV
jgi:DNA-binding NarL/FixJ family response regulator